jgi:hypothetical protein
METRTVKDALTKFDLIAGAGSEDSKQACAMTLLAWLAGQTWTDHPVCAHPILCNAVIRGNDASGTTKKMRADLVKAGATGVLDTWWIPGEVIAFSLGCKRDAESPSDFDRALSAMKFISGWKKDKTRPNLSYANLSYANLHSADLRSADLHYANLHSANLSYANLSYANLHSANLRSADLHYANLHSADLHSANLHSADLRSAVGNSYTKLPVGWTVSDSGLIVKST